MEESLEEKKERLKKEINELKVVSSNLEYGIGITKFGHDDNIKTVHECLKYLNKNENNVHDTQVNLQYTLYSYAGIHCVKFTDNCVVFKFASFGEYKKCDKYAVQIMIEDDKAKLGHWIMPNWLDIHQVLLETPLQNPRNIMCFIRNCKHHIYCYHHRMTHFNNLKSLTSEMINCHIWTNLNYTQINLELFEVQEMESSTYLDLVLYLEYHSCEIKPYRGVIDSLGTRKFPERRIKALTLYLKYFKHMNLEEAFKSLIDGSATSYIWVPKIDSDSALDLNDISDTESETYKNIRSSLKRKRRRIRPIKRKQYEKQKSLLDKVTVEDNPILTLENKRKKTEKISGTPSSVNKFETSRNVKSKFKQTQLNFEVSKTKKQTAVSDETDTESERSRSTTQSSASTKKLPVFTSTPSRAIRQQVLQICRRESQRSLLIRRIR
ncbi:uncharacterized protein LOC107270759 isoform X3 [Cephus cinctus]|uniref:Uncharacterized protein LOC107270759 isoform X3 n=1 Tax=Cephus cinctus TaxID=211228 RepID=A0AAJ7RNU1_CEPCN|nr:uncharacterized protein LOC107270759 isoform X3 [Cephus cinctus]